MRRKFFLAKESQSEGETLRIHSFEVGSGEMVASGVLEKYKRVQ